MQSVLDEAVMKLSNLIIPSYCNLYTCFDILSYYKFGLQFRLAYKKVLLLFLSETHYMFSFLIV